jgi:hypothetical protein
MSVVVSMMSMFLMLSMFTVEAAMTSMSAVPKSSMPTAGHRDGDGNRHRYRNWGNRIIRILVWILSL